MSPLGGVIKQRFGWEHFLNGFVTVDWVRIQQAYLEWIGKKTTGEHWVQRLITQLWEVAWEMWRHRVKVMKTPEALTTVAQNAALDVGIQERYALLLLLLQYHMTAELLPVQYKYN